MNRGHKDMSSCISCDLRDRHLRAGGLPVTHTGESEDSLLLGKRLGFFLFL